MVIHINALHNNPVSLRYMDMTDFKRLMHTGEVDLTSSLKFSGAVDRAFPARGAGLR